MIVTCPSCGVRYLVDARALGAKGRTVRCARCAHSWYEDTPPPSELEAAAAAAAAAADPTKPAPPPLQPPPPPRVPPLTAEQRVQLPALPARRRRWGAGPAIWSLAVLALLAAVAYAAVIDRDRVVGILPAAASLYSSLGLKTGVSGLGLELRNLTTNRETANGLPTLVIGGEVRNVSGSARTVPKLVVILRDRGDHDLQDQTVDAPVDRLQPGESAPFHTVITQPAEAASDIIVQFAGDKRS
jgi:predicted Zn finger-like uncharacterized protein